MPTPFFEPGGARLSSLVGQSVNEVLCHDVRGRLRQLVSVAAGVAVVCGAALPLNAVAAVDYAYDERGNRLVESRVSGGVSSSRQFGHDGSDRLTGELSADGTATTWELSADGARTFETRYSSFSGSLAPPFGGGVITSRQQYAYDSQGALSRIDDAVGGGTVASFGVDERHGNGGRQTADG
mgnify:CR=1 FL=1